LIRTFNPGDEAQQAAVYNEAAGRLSGFKPAGEDEIRRRTRARDFDPSTRLYAEVDGRVVGYATWNPNGRVGFPWCLPGHEQWAEPLFAKALEGLRGKGVAKAFAAYRADWPDVIEFLTGHGFAKAREVWNFVMDPCEMPTMAPKPSMPISPLERSDVPAVAAMGEGVIRIPAGQLEKYLFANQYFPAESLFVMRGREGGEPMAVGLAIEDAKFADPLQIDSKMPCFRLGAFGSEGMSVKRVNGLFSFLVKPGQNTNALGLDLLAHAAYRLEGGSAPMIAAQAPDDAPALFRFYTSFFRKQGAFPVFERSL
jgi:hypothetical protein